MVMEATPVSALPDFGQEHFGAANLGHKKRNACLVRIADALMRHPGGTLPDKLQSPAEYKAMIRLANRPETTHQAVLQAHLDRTFVQLRQLDGVGLLIHDGTELDYSGLHSITTLGPIGNGHNRGYLCHNSLAVDPGSGMVLGLAGQILHTRVPVPKGEGVKAKRERESRESRLWTQAIEVMPTAPTGKLWVDIADRGADLFEFLASEDAHDRSYVVRACFSRKIGIGHGAQPEPGALHVYARSLAESGRRQITVSDGKGGQRKATVAMSFGAVQLLPPHVKRGLYEPRPLPVWVIRVWEIDAPAGVTPVEWILLTNVAVATVADAWERVGWYERRWLVEEYHKAQKTGCAIEDMQFTTEDALQPMIALLSVVAVQLLNLRAAARREDATTRPAKEVVHEDYVAVLSAWRYKELRELTVHEFFYALGRLGGHQNRKCDKQPGWLVLWRGWMKLQSMVDGAAILGATKYKFRRQS
jgi:Transposase DNA-binding